MDTLARPVPILTHYPIWPSEVVNLVTSDEEQLTIGRNSVLY